MTKSMTGFASASGQAAGHSWVWDIRSVNARGLDIRLRLPDWLDGLEQALRPEIQKAAKRGSISLGLRIQRDQGAEELGVDDQALDRALALLKRVETQAQEAHNLVLSASSAAQVLGMRGVSDTSKTDTDPKPVIAALMKQLPDLLAGFDAMRTAEGRNLNSVLGTQIDDIETLTSAARKAADDRKTVIAANLRANLTRILDNADGADPDRVAQELAIIAVKTDVTEEIDRLISHVAAARELLASDGAVGRKLDFLSQEFNREANTLCSKAQSPELTRIGLDLKAVIDQMREQVQNVE